MVSVNGQAEVVARYLSYRYSRERVVAIWCMDLPICQLYHIGQIEVPSRLFSWYRLGRRDICMGELR
jgi:hypothetical protein